MAKQRERKPAKYTEEFRRQAVERMKETDNIKALARELGVERRSLYDWRKRAADLKDRRATNGRSKQEQKIKEIFRNFREKKQAIAQQGGDNLDDNLHSVKKERRQQIMAVLDDNQKRILKDKLKELKGNVQ